jgi:type I restriction enzyme S subunit
MNDLSFLDKLLDGVAVVWMPLGQVGEFIRGNGMQKKDFVEDGFPAIHYGQIYTRYGLAANTAFTCVEEGLAKRLRKAKNNDLLLATTSENDEDVVKPLAWLGTEVAISGDMMLFRHKQKVKYLAHYLQTNEFQEQKRKYITGAKVRRVSSGDLSKITVPIPCPENPKKSLEIQAEIVRILDAFTELTTELNTELTTRKKQYNHYRDQLLSFEDGDVAWKTLGDVTKKWYSGGTPTAGATKYYEGGAIPWLRTQEVKFSDIQSTEVKITEEAVKKTAAKWIPANCVIVAISGATAGRSAINKIPLTTNQHCGCLEIDASKALYRYVFHWVSFNFENIKALGQGARGDLNSSIIKNFKLPIPYANDPEKSLAEQARIVAILDKFDALTNSLTEGLPREIELRQKQYEHYRDLLLSFPKPQEVVA